MNDYHVVDSLVLDNFLEEVFAGFYFTFGPVLLLSAIVFAVQLLCRQWLTSRQLCWLWAIVLVRLMMPVVPESDFSMLNLFVGDEAERTVHGLDIQYQVAGSSETWTPIDSPQVVYSNPQAVTPPERSLLVMFDDILQFIAWSIYSFWLVGAACVLSWAFVNQFKFAWRVRKSASCEDGRIISLLRECRRDLYVRQEIALHIVEELKHPALFGFWRPKILLPADAMELTDDQLRMVLLHELAHVKRRDILGNWLLLVVQCVHWWNPLYYLAASCYMRFREQDCDAMVVEQIGRQHMKSYGELLLEYASQPIRWGHVVLPASLIGIFSSLFRKRSLKSRLGALKQAGASRHHLQSAVVVLLFFVLVATGFTNAREPEPVAPVETYSVPQIVSPPENRISGPVKIVVYEVKDALEANRKDFSEDQVDQADEMFLVTVKQLIGFASNKTPISPDSNEAKVDEFSCALNGTQLVVRAAESQHKELQRLLPLWEHGFNIQHIVECRVLTSPQDLSELVGETWKPMKSPMSLEQSDVLDSGNPTEVQVVAYSVVEQYLPMIASVMKKEKVRQVLQTVQANARSNAMMSPKVTTFNGQQANIFSGTQRPFVTSVSPDQNGVLKPDITVVNEGIGMDILSTSRNGQEQIEVEAQIKLSEIQDVNTFTTKWKGKDVTVQMPTVQNRRVVTTVSMNSGESFLVGFAPSKGESDFLYVLLTIRKIDVQELAEEGISSE